MKKIRTCNGKKDNETGLHILCKIDIEINTFNPRWILHHENENITETNTTPSKQRIRKNK